MARERGSQPEQRGVSGRLIVAIIAVILLVWFALGNSNYVRVDFFVTHRHVRLVYVILVAAILGFIAGWFAARARK